MLRRGRKRSGIRMAVCFAAALVWLLPFYWMIRSALMSMSQIFVYLPVFIPDAVRWENFPEALTRLPFLTYFRNTVFIVTFCVAGILFSCSLSAYGLSRIQWKGRDLVFSILMACIMLPYFATIIPSFVMWTKLGLTNTFIPLILPCLFPCPCAAYRCWTDCWGKR